VRRRECKEKPTVEVNGLGHGMRAITAAMDPLDSRSGRPDRNASIAYMSSARSGERRK
jgi:hypothetical protein